jgi:hypothetical protein
MIRTTRLASLVLSLFLHVAPLVRVAVADTAAAISPIMALLRWAAGAAAVAGSFHAVSGATGITITQGDPSTTVSAPMGTNGAVSGFRVLIQSSQHGKANSYKATGLPPGMILTSITGGVIGGVPTTDGTFTARIRGYKTANQTGENYSAVFSVTVTIVGAKPVITLPPQPATVDEGQSATLSVTATGAELTYRWIKGGIELPLTAAGATNASISFNPAKVSDTGDYQVRVTGSGGSTLSASARLTVNAVAVNPPVITALPTAATVSLGGTATFSVTATGTGLAYQWRKGDQTLNGETSPALTLNPVNATSGGTYTVRVSNAGGAVEASAILTVAPVIVSQSGSAVKIHLGETLRLSVTANGPAPLTYQWFRNEAPLATGTAADLAINAATANEAGTYTVRVSAPGASVNGNPVAVEVRSLALDAPQLSGNALALGWPAIAGRTYRIEGNSSLGGTWTTAGEVTATGESASFNAPADAGFGFFRLVPQ